MDTALLLASLRATPPLLRRLTEEVSPELAGRPPKAGEWSISEVVRHLLEGDRDTFLPRLRRMLAEDRPTFESRDREVHPDRLDLGTLLDRFECARADVVRTLADLEPSGWAREGVSPSRGVLTVETYATTMAGHDTEHLQQIHQLRSVLGLRPKRAEARVALPLSEIAALIEPVPRKVEALCRGLSAGQLRRRPREGEWSMKEVMAHLAKVERDLFVPRLRRIVTEECPHFERFDPDAWAAERDHREGDFMADWREFAELRRQTQAFLASLSPEAAGRMGLSGFFGPVTLATYATHVADHDAEHLAQLEACRAAVAD